MDEDAIITIAACLAWYRLMKKIPNASIIFDHKTEYKHYPVLSRVNSEVISDFLVSYDNDDVSYEDKNKMFKEAACKIAEIKNKRVEIPDILEQADSFRNFALDDDEMEAINKGIVSTLLKNTKKIDLLMLKLEKNYLFTSGLSPRHQNSLVISYYIQDNSINFTFINYRNFDQHLCFEIRRELIRAIKNINLIFPLASQIWGNHHYLEKRLSDRQKGILQVHRQLSDHYISRRTHIEDKHGEFQRPKIRPRRA